MTTVAEVRLWGQRVGAVSLEDRDEIAVFQYDSPFVHRGTEVSPLVMPLRAEPYAFPSLPLETFRGLPGLLADSLPDRFGNALINTWLATQGRGPESFNAIERLCYVGTRGMGALEFAPPNARDLSTSEPIDIAELVRLASDVLTRREELLGSLGDEPSRNATLKAILSVGTSAGGARAKAVIAWNRDTNVVRSGQVAAGNGFEHWILKFDGVSGNKDKEFEDPQGYGVIEYAYSLMAREAGVGMSECRLLEENGRQHFMTRRFDRPAGDRKLHMQSLGALAHYDYNQAHAYSYEQAINAIRQLGLSVTAVEQQFRRMAFNVVARNQDDHVKNIAFLMEPGGSWALSPAFDVTYAYAPSGRWTNQHQMSLNGKWDGFDLDDFCACAEVAAMKKGRAEEILAEVTSAVQKWRLFAEEAGVPEPVAEAIERAHRLSLLTT
jgi:serine/threonine-protein kinase HipA